ncbi:TPA: hypothetical protein H2W85_003243 [Salmonella enterica]|nr:hypothetical protein [Salmonella enterica]
MATYTTSGSIAGIHRVTIKVSGTTSNGYQTYMVAPDCKPINSATTRLVLKKTFRDDANNVIYTMENPERGGIWVDDNEAYAFEGNTTTGGFRCTLGYSGSGVPGKVNAVATYTMKPIDTSLGVPSTWTSQLPYWITANQNDKLPSTTNPWDKALLMRSPTGTVVLQYTDITYCYLTVDDNTLRHEFFASQKASESLNAITVSSVCNLPAKMKIKLANTDSGTNEVKLSDGLTSLLYLNDAAIPVEGLLITTLKGSSVIGKLRSHITNTNLSLKPGVYSGSASIVYTIE